MKRILLFLLFSLLLPVPSIADQSTITESEGFSCMGDEKSRKDARREALQEAKRIALEQVLSHVKSVSMVKDYVIEKDVVEAYTEGDLKILEQTDLGWYKDEHAGECYKVRIKAEVTPKEEKMQNAFGDSSIDNPSMPLAVKVWTNKQRYSRGEHVKIYLKGNKPFYGKVVYKDAEGNLIQLLPNPYRSENYFQGGVVYEIPSGNDRFNLEITPPFGSENITVYGSSSPLGETKLENLGEYYRVISDDVGLQSRGVKFTQGVGNNDSSAEFAEESVSLSTGQ